MDEKTKQKYQQLFLQSAQQYLLNFNANLQSYLRSKTEQAAIEQMFISVHSIRSQCNVMGYTELANDCGEVESMLRPIKDSLTPLTNEQLAFLQEQGKNITLLLNSIANELKDDLPVDSHTVNYTSLPNKKVLLIEDDHFFQNFYAYKLHESGFTTQIASNGDEGIKKLQDFMPNVVLLDLIMPVKDGFEFLAEKRQSSLKDLVRIPVIVFSTLGQEKDIQRARELGAVDYINKSFFDYSKLIEKVNAYLTS